MLFDVFMLNVHLCYLVWKRLISYILLMVSNGLSLSFWHFFKLVYIIARSFTRITYDESVSWASLIKLVWWDIQLEWRLLLHWGFSFSEILSRLGLFNYFGLKRWNLGRSLFLGLLFMSLIRWSCLFLFLSLAFIGFWRMRFRVFVLFLLLLFFLLRFLNYVLLRFL